MGKKIGVAVAGLALLATPFLANADAASDLQAKIQALLAQIQSLQQQIATLQAATKVTVNPIACTMEAKICPDGSSVGRSGPNCEFAACPGTTPVSVCPILNRSLSVGSSGSDVQSLQAYLGVSQTGFFGPLTSAAVAKFQADAGISAIGAVGPLTRAAFVKRCQPGNPPPTICNKMPIMCPAGYHNGGTCNLDCLPDSSTSLSASPASGQAPLSVSFTYHPDTDDSSQYSIDFGDGQSQQIMDIQHIVCIKAPCISPSVASHTYTVSGTYTATVSRYIACMYTNPRCMIAVMPLAKVQITVGAGSTSGAPSISGVDGPTTLGVGAQGSWNVHVTDSSGYLSYAVRWGDEASVPPLSGLAAANAVSSSGTFTHTYATAGTYSPTFTVTNGNGQSASAGASVVVGSGSGNQVFSASPLSGAAPLTVTFSNMVGGFTANTFSIDFGDGTQAAATTCSAPADACISPGIQTHTYTAAGTYTAKLIETNFNTCAAQPGYACPMWYSAAQTLGSVTIAVH